MTPHIAERSDPESTGLGVRPDPTSAGPATPQASVPTVDDVLEKIHQIEQCAKELGQLRAEEIDLTDIRARTKIEAITRLIGTPNALSNDKPHTFSSAETRVEEDGEYLNVRLQQAENLLNQELWRGRGRAAELRAQLAIALLKEER